MFDEELREKGALQNIDRRIIVITIITTRCPVAEFGEQRFAQIIEITLFI